VSRGRPKKSEGRDTRKAILDAALDIFSRQGYQATSVREIARAVGIRESSIYAHFEGKAAILNELFHKVGPTPGLNYVNGIVVDQVIGEPAVFLRTICDYVIDVWTKPEHIKFVRLLLMESLLGNQTLAVDFMAAAQELRDGILRIVSEFVHRGVIKGFDEEVVMTAFVGPLQHLRHEHLFMARGPIDVNRFRAAVYGQLDFFLKAVGLER
jgi:AcrR family transcriptional regulator